MQLGGYNLFIFKEKTKKATIQIKHFQNLVQLFSQNLCNFVSLLPKLIV